jgi:hypothetical protein
MRSGSRTKLANKSSPPLRTPRPAPAPQIINVAPEGSEPNMMDATEDMRAFHPALCKGGAWPGRPGRGARTEGRARRTGRAWS